MGDAAVELLVQSTAVPQLMSRGWDIDEYFPLVRRRRGPDRPEGGFSAMKAARRNVLLARGTPRPQQELLSGQ